MTASSGRRYPKLADQLPGRRAIITGAGAGLGRAMALELGGDGWTLCLVDRDADGLASLSKDLQQSSAKFVSHVVDVTNEATLEALIHAFCKKQGGIDMLVNSAGVGHAGPPDAFSGDDWRTLFAVNVIAIGCATAAVLPYMKAATRGRVVNIASAAAYHCLPWLGSYSASKAAVVALTESLAAELSDTEIKASVMISTFFRSSMPRYTLGGPSVRQRIAGMMALSHLTSRQAAVETLRGIEARKTYILVGRQARVIYWVKRFAPRLWLRLAPGVARKAYGKADEIAARTAFFTTGR